MGQIAELNARPAITHRHPFFSDNTTPTTEPAGAARTALSTTLRSASPRCTGSAERPLPVPLICRALSQLRARSCTPFTTLSATVASAYSATVLSLIDARAWVPPPVCGSEKSQSSAHSLLVAGEPRSKCSGRSQVSDLAVTWFVLAMIGLCPTVAEKRIRLKTNRNARKAQKAALYFPSSLIVSCFAAPHARRLSAMPADG